MGVPTTIQIYLSVAIPVGFKALFELVVYFCFRSSWPQFFCSARPDHELGRAGACEWTYRLLTLDDEQVLSTTGVDGLAYLLFQKFALKACLFSAAIGLVVLGPVFFVGDARGSAHGFDRWSFANVGRTSEEGPTCFWALWAMVAVAYCQQAVALALLHAADRRVCAAAVTAAAEGTARKYALVVTDVPAARPPHPLGSVGTVREMVAAALGADDRVLRARAVSVTHRAGGLSLADLRAGDMRARLGTYFAALDALAHAHAAEAKARDAGKPAPKAGLCGGGPLTAVESATKELAAADASCRALLKARDEKRQSLHPEAAPVHAHAVIVVVKSLVAATTLAAVPLTAESAETWNVAPAPEPRDVDWATLEALPRAPARRTEAALAAAAFYALTVFWTVPVSAVTASLPLSNVCLRSPP